MAAPTTPGGAAGLVLLGGMLKTAVRAGLQQVLSTPTFTNYIGKQVYSAEQGRGPGWDDLPPGERAVWELRIRRTVDAIISTIG